MNFCLNVSSCGKIYSVVLFYLSKLLFHWPNDQIVLFQDIKGYCVISLQSESYNQNSKGSSDQLSG